MYTQTILIMSGQDHVISNQLQKNDKHTLPSQENVMFSQMVLLQLNILFVWLAENPSLQKYWTVSLLKS